MVVKMYNNTSGLFNDYNEIKKDPKKYKNFLIDSIGTDSLSHKENSNNYYLLPNGKMYDCDWAGHKILLRILFLEGIAETDNDIEAERLGYIKVSQNSIHIPKFPVTKKQYNVLEDMFLENDSYLYLYGIEYKTLDKLYEFLIGDKL